MQNPEGGLGKRFGRRSFGKLVAAGVAALATGALLLRRNAESSSSEQPPLLEETDYDAYPKPEGLPSDILTKEELKKAGITVYQIPEVQLYLRKSALEIPIFKDAANGANGKINGLTISLINSDRTSWGNIDRLPDEPKAAWQKVNADDNPETWNEETWQKVQEYQSSSLQMHQNFKNYYEKNLSEVLSGQREKTVKQGIDTYKSLLQKRDSRTDPDQVTDWYTKLTSLEHELDDLLNGQEEIRTRQKIMSEEKALEKTKDSLQVLAGPKNEAIRFFREYGIYGAQGELIRPGPEWDNKAFIFLCVGGEYEPEPKQSYPGPRQFKVFKNKNSYTVYDKDPSPGFNLHHEAGHYEGKDPDFAENENLANKAAFERIIKAWLRHQQTSDNSEYSFVFVSPKGITITEKLAETHVL